MEPDSVSRPPLATRPAAHPTQIFTRTRTELQLESLTAAGNTRGLEVSTPAVAAGLEREPNHCRHRTTPYRSRLYATRPSPITKIGFPPHFSIFTELALYAL